MNKKITILLPNLKAGGAERLAVLLANEWIQRNISIDILLLKKEGEFLSLVSSNVKIIDLNVKRIRGAFMPLIKYLKESKPSILWVGMWPLTSIAIIAWIFSFRIGKIYIIDHIPLTISAANELMVNEIFLKIVMKLTYPLASGRMAVSEGVAKDLCKLTGMKSEQFKVIYNPACREIFPEKISKDKSTFLWGEGYDYHILSVGEFKQQKNFKLLIKAFSKIAEKINAKLTIVGEGSQRRELEYLIKSLGLEERVSLPGFYKDPYQWFSSADLFVLSSDWEGLPTVLIEALECGLNIVSTDCQHGPSEILVNGKYGKLVSTGCENSLAKGIVDSLKNKIDDSLLRKRALDFSVSTISSKYLDYFEI